MRQEEVLTAEQLDARLATQTLKEHSRLWRRAEGRLGWRGVVGLLSPLLLIAIGVAQSFQSGSLSGLFHESGGAWFMALGFGTLALTAWANMQGQLNAALELLRRLERTRS